MKIVVQNKQDLLNPIEIESNSESTLIALDRLLKSVYFFLIKGIEAKYIKIRKKGLLDSMFHSVSHKEQLRPPASFFSTIKKVTVPVFLAGIMFGLGHATAILIAGKYFKKLEQIVKNS